MFQSVVNFMAGLSPNQQTALIASSVTLAGALVATFGALIGVFVNHLGAERRFAKQLKHDRDQKRIDREMELRKSVFLDCAVAVHDAITMVSSYANVQKTSEELFKDFKKKSAALSQAHVVGNNETVNTLQAFSIGFGKAITRLELMRQPITKLQGQLISIDKVISDSFDEQRALTKQLNQSTFEGSTTQAKLDFFNRASAYSKKTTDDAIANRKILEDQFKSEFAKLYRATFEESAKLRSLISPAVKAVREELGLPLDYDKYVNVMEEDSKLQLEMLNSFADNLLQAKE